MENSPSLLEKKWVVMVAWQVCSVFLCGIASVCTWLTKINGKTLPVTQLAISYIILISRNLFFEKPKSIPWGKYFFVSFFNFSGDICSIYAYTMTSLSSSMILVTTVIFWVAPISYFVFKRSVSLCQGFSLFLGFFGVFIVFLEDGAGDTRWKGNIIAIVSAMCYAIATVIQEALVHDANPNTYLYGFSSTITPLSLVSILIFERKDLLSYNWTKGSIILILVYAVLMAVYYMMVPQVMQYSNATEMNLSFLSSNFMSLGVSILAFGQKASIMYLVGFMCVPFAIALYSLYPNSSSDEKQILE